MTSGDALLQGLTTTAETAGGNDWAAVERGQGRPDARQLREMALSRVHAHTNLAMGTAAVRGEAFSWSEFKPQLEPLLKLFRTRALAPANTAETVSVPVPPPRM